nr:hypothetical protein [uncultured Bacteroides sp.]
MLLCAKQHRKRARVFEDTAFLNATFDYSFDYILFSAELLIYHCLNSTDSVEPALTLSKEELTFRGEVGMQKLAIKTNVGWLASSFDDDKQYAVGELEDRWAML